MPDKDKYSTAHRCVPSPEATLVFRLLLALTFILSAHSASEFSDADTAQVVGTTKVLIRSQPEIFLALLPGRATF